MRAIITYLGAKQSRLFWFIFIYILLAGLLSYHYYFQPMGYGDLSRVDLDVNKYHKLALNLFNEIEENGWQAWKLRAGGFAISGIAAVLYKLFAPIPIVLLPMNALLMALSALSVVRTGVNLGSQAPALRLAVIPFLLFPSSLSWGVSLNKDVFFVFGLCLVAEAITFSARLAQEETSSIKNVRTALLSRHFWCLSLLGMVFIWLARPYMMMLVCGGLFVVIAFWLAAYVVKKSFRTGNPVIVLSMLLCVFVLTMNVLTQLPDRLTGNNIKRTDNWNTINREISFYEERTILKNPESAKEQRSPIERYFYNFVDSIIYHRKGYFKAYALSHTLIDQESISDRTDLITYFPRSFVVGWLLPSPWQWLSAPAGSSRIMYMVIGAEMLIAYLGYAGLFISFFKAEAKKRSPYLTLIVFIAAILLPIIYCTPNLGTLYRARYGHVLLLGTIGVSYWVSRYLNFHFQVKKTQ